MRILLFEWLTGGGLAWQGQPLDRSSSLFREGEGMLQSLIAAFTSAGNDVQWLRDPRIAGFTESDTAGEVVSAEPDLLPMRLRELAEGAEKFLVVAPESDGCLSRTQDWLRGLESRALAPTGPFTTLGCSKDLTLSTLEASGVQKPFGSLWRPSTPVPHTAGRDGPWILKPDDGAGSESIWIASDPERLRSFPADPERRWRVERFLPGAAVSVSVIGGPSGPVLLPPLLQYFGSPPGSPGGHAAATERAPVAAGDGLEEWPGPWQGFDFPLPADWNARALALADRALKALPHFTGWAGLDLVLAPGSPADDRIVDLNPRLTSSWIGLGELLQTNPAQLMLDVISGKTRGVVPPGTMEPMAFRLQGGKPERFRYRPGQTASG